MANKLFLELVSPEKSYLSVDVDEVYLPGAEGDLGILPDHVAFFSALREGEMHYRIGSEVEYVAIDGGFLEVENNKVTVLADGVALGKEIDLEAVINSKAQTEKELEEARRKDNFDMKFLEAKLKREITRIKVANRYKD